MLSGLASFNHAKRHRRGLMPIGAIFAGLGLAAAGGATLLPQPFARAAADLGAAALLAAAGLIAAALESRTRERLLAAELAEEPCRPPGAGFPAIVAALLAVLATAVVYAGRILPGADAASAVALQTLTGALVLLAFPILVLERTYTDLAPASLPEAPQVARLLRVPLTACLALALGAALRSLGFAAAGYFEDAVALLVVAVAGEILLRVAALAFRPEPPVAVRRAVADSAIARCLRLTPPRLGTLNLAIRRRFGIDLSRSWALAFLVRALVPAALGMGFCAWALTGVTALRLDERAVYERLGTPVAVLDPGIHLHLPWPLGRIRHVELGVTHEIPIVLAPAVTGAVAAGAEDIPPASADRLWDASHPAEASYLIASALDGQQSFQVVNIDIRIVYRIGLGDDDARAAAYAVADPETLIRAATGQLLVRHFAQNTLLDVLGESRERFAAEFRRALQARLDALATGIEAIAVVVEAIHPPPAAAGAYHYVQAAEILANSAIATKRAKAIRLAKWADQTALLERNEAAAAAAELTSEAGSEGVRFAADAAANHASPRVFRLERWFERLAQSLARAQFVVVDHRLAGENAPTIDLRSLAALADGGPPRPPRAPAGPGKSDDED